MSRTFWISLTAIFFCAFAYECFMRIDASRKYVEAIDTCRPTFVQPRVEA